LNRDEDESGTQLINHSHDSGMRREEVCEKEFMISYDSENGLPETSKEDVLHWKNFNEDFYSTPADSTSVEHIMDANPDATIDLRPYMIMHSFVCHPHDDLTRANELFRHHHLRHLPVINPGNGALVGIVTRKDLFRFMAL